jgi:molybdopterin biosynthesis enzyme
MTVQALDKLGVRWEKRGVPAHPGSTYWLAYLGTIPVLGMASCGMFSRATVLDLILPRFFTGQHVNARMLAALGYGGLLNKGMAYRFPDYASPEITTADTE